MRAAWSFDEVLDERIGAIEPMPAYPRPPVALGTAASYGFFFDLHTTHSDASRSALATAGFAAAASSLRAPSVPGRPAPIPDRTHARQRDAGDARLAHFCTSPLSGESAAGSAPRPSRRLSLRQREALETLRTLGATLPADFTDDELRRAFRTLARRYHPDRHPGCSDEQRSTLCSLFGHAYEAYEVLSH